MEHDQSSYFCRGPEDFCWGPAPVGPTLVTGPQELGYPAQKNLLRLFKVLLRGKGGGSRKTLETKTECVSMYVNKHVT